MVTAQELAVRIKSEGVDETREGVEKVGNSMEDTAEKAGNSAEELQGFSEEFQGAMSTAVTALAIAAGGLLSQVPILGEAFSGLGAIVDAIALKMDSVLRPVLTPITQGFFKIANAINDTDGIMAKIIGTVASVLSIATVLIGVAAQVGSVLGVWASAGAGVVSILGTIVGVISTVAGVILSLPVAIGVAIAAIAGFLAAYLLNWRGTRDKTDKIVGQIKKFVVNGFNSFVNNSLNVLDSFVSDVIAFFGNIASDLSQWGAGLASDAKEWGKNMLQAFIKGIKNQLGRLRSFLADLRDIGSNVGISVPSLGGIGGGGGGGGGGGNVTRSPFGGTGIGRRTQIDGRTLTESTGRYRSDPSRRRGL